MAPYLKSVMGFATLFFIYVGSPCLYWVTGQEPTPRKSAIEQRLEKIKEVAFGASQEKVPKMPYSEAALRKYIEDLRQQYRHSGSGIFAWEKTARGKWALFVIAREQLENENPPRERLTSVAPFYDLRSIV